MAAESAEAFHTPVMAGEVVGLLAPVLGRGALVDATAGGAGHTCALLEQMEHAGAGGVLLGVDIDPEAIDAARQRLARSGFADADSGGGSVMVKETQRGGSLLVRLLKASYADLAGVVRELGLGPVAGVLMDLGVSLHQLSQAGRGFSYDREGPIDMRFDPGSRGPSALDLLRRTPARTVQRWLSEYAQEPRSGGIARALHEGRRGLKTTADLVRVVGKFAAGRPARTVLARVFQALRIATNRELDVVAAGLDAALDVLMTGGRLVVISYHSGEDRLVKRRFQEGSRGGRLQLAVRKPLRPTPAEVAANPRARSARLRAAEVVA
jgi:16S rRNA (cytosine1402-N4)-methyltransferase